MRAAMKRQTDKGQISRVITQMIGLGFAALAIGGTFTVLAKSITKSDRLPNSTKETIIFDRGLMSKAWGVSSKYGVSAPKAWNLMTKDCSKSNVVVAVIDTGLNTLHPSLKDSLWTNEKELKGKPGVDEDGNGLVDDVHGWDFATNSPLIVDNHGHGTHIAGIISANGTGIHQFKGICPGVKIMPLRYYNPKASGSENLKNTIRAINYAVEKGVSIINYSGGGAEFAKDEFDALKRAESKGILVVAAAGNEKNNADKIQYFPAAYNLTNIISVTAIDENGFILPSSNWGMEKVHVAAPGQNILSTDNSGGYTFMSGTSQATAFVSGIAALLMTENPSLVGHPQEIKSLIESSARILPQLAGKAKTSAEADAFLAMEKLKGLNKVKPIVSPRVPATKKLVNHKVNRKVAAKTTRKK